jgi:hypothetical protein
VELGIIEAVAFCMKKRMLVTADEDVTIRCLNLLTALLEGISWDDTADVLEKDAQNFRQEIKIKVVSNDLVNDILLLVQKTVEKKGTKAILIEALHVLYCVLSRDNLLTLSLDIDASKEFAVVEAIDNQLAVDHRSPDTYSTVWYGCMVLEAFVRLHPELRRNSTCSIIRKLLFEVNNVFYPLPYHFCDALGVLDVLFTNEVNIAYFQDISLFIYTRLVKLNNSGGKLSYKDLENTLLTHCLCKSEA